MLLIVAAAGLASLSFQAGRNTAIAQRNSNLAKKAQSHRSVPSGGNDRLDIENVTIGNAGAVSFQELYDLLQIASPERRLAWAKQLEEMPVGPQKFAAIDSFYKALVQIDPPAAADAVIHSSDLRTQEAAAAAAVGAAPPSGLADMAEMLTQLRGRWKRTLDDVLFNWSAFNPVAASQFVGQHLDDVSDAGFFLVASNWAAIDPPATKVWVERLDQRHQSAEAIRGLVMGWKDNDRESALDYAITHADEERFQSTIRNLADALFHESPEQARLFTLRLPSDKSRTEAIEAVVATATSIMMEGPRDWPRPPEDVAKWLITLPHDLWKGEMANLLSNWQQGGPKAALAWIEQLPAENRGLVLSEYCPTGDGVDPKRVLTLATNIDDANIREQALRKFVDALGGTREKAIASLSTLNLSASQKKYLASLLKKE